MEQQCLGTTRSGERCKISRNLTDGYCHIHRQRAASAMPDPAAPAVEPPRRPTTSADPHEAPEAARAPASSDNRNTPLIAAAFLLLFLLLVGGIRKTLIKRTFSRRE